MSNWVRNIVHMKGIARLPLFTKEEDEENCYTNFDFEKIIPLPDKLRRFLSGRVDECIVYYLTERCTLPIRKLPSDKAELLEKLVTNPVANLSCPEEVFHQVMARAFDSFGKEREAWYQNGKTYISNIKLYGVPDRKEWCEKHWGSWRGTINTAIIDADTISFDTVQTNPAPILLKLAEQHPDIEIEHWWAGDDKGNNTGYRKLCAGKILEEYDLDKTVLALYAKCWGKGDKCFYRDDYGVCRRRKCEECHQCD